MTLPSLKTRAELLLITAGWLWTFSAAALVGSNDVVRLAVAAGLGLMLSLVFRPSVMAFFRTDLDNLADKLADAYLWSIVAFVFGLVLAGYALAGGPSPFAH